MPKQYNIYHIINQFFIIKQIQFIGLTEVLKKRGISLQKIYFFWKY